MESIDISIKWPFKWCLVGTSGSGKTNFSLNIVKNSTRIFDAIPSRLIVIYREFQNIYNRFQEFLPTQLINETDVDIDDINKDNKENLLIICDDLYFSQKLVEISEQFLITGRHRNTSWIVLTQTIFNHPSLKNISRNSSHITLFKSIRLIEPHTFFSQLRPKSSQVLQNIYKKATEKGYSYLDIDLSQTCPDKYRYKTDLFKEIVTVYMIMNGDSFKTMYLIGKSELDKLENKNESERIAGENFRLSLENKNLCEDGVNLSIKPIKKRKTRNTQENKDSKKESTENTTERDKGEKSKSDVYSEQNTSPIATTPSRYPDIREIPSEIPEDTSEMEKGSQSRVNVSRSNSFSDKEDDSLSHRLKRLQGKIEESASRGKKRKALHIDNEQELIRGKQFQHYPFLERNEEQHLIPETENKTAGLQDDNVEISNSNKGNRDLKDNDVEMSSNSKEIDKIKFHPQPEMTSTKNTLKRRKKENDWTLKNNEQWIRGLKSVPRAQFKRKKDTIGFRINPIDVQKSLISPNDFKFLNKDDSGEILDKWKSLSELRTDKFKTKRFKPYRSFSVYR